MFETQRLNYVRGIIGELRMSNGCPSSVEPPMPRLLSKMSSFDDASRSMKDGSQSALVAAKPFKTRSGRPFPIRR